KLKNGSEVELIPEQVTLLRVDDDVPEPSDLIPGRSALAERKLEDLQQQEKGPAKGGNVVRTNAPFTISDSRARILKVWAVAGSRTAGFFRDGKGDIRPEAVTSTISQEPQTIVVQATKAPGKITPLTIIPAFKFEPDAYAPFTLERKVRMRIRMQRPWFTSG